MTPLIKSLIQTFLADFILSIGAAFAAYQGDWTIESFKVFGWAMLVAAFRHAIKVVWTKIA